MPTMRSGGYEGGSGRRSSQWLDREDLDGFLHRSWLKSTGVGDQTFRDRPLIGICNSWSELVNCNVHLRGLAEAVKRGVLQAGGFPREFPVMSLGESLMKPTAMLYRNLMAMDVEESIRSYPLDGVVLLTGCDKTNPAAIMGACSANIPTIVVTGGPMLNGRWRDNQIGSCSDCWRYHEELRAGRISETDFVEVENAISRSHGHCMTMGTASTMACMTEALGLTLPGGAAIPAVDSRRAHLAEAAGRQIVELVQRNLRPSDILTRDSFENAIRALHAISGSTNALIHLTAYAGRLDLDLPLSLFDDLGQSTPWLVDLKPAGAHLMEDFYYAGGLPAVLDQIRDQLALDTITVTGRNLGENLDSASTEIINEDVIRPRSNPLAQRGSLAVLRGNICPDGAVMKFSAADPRLLAHEGRAVVFEDIHDLAERVDDPDLDVDSESVMLLRNAGPVGGPGMPEWGHLPIPAKLLKQGVTDVLRISDARMSGTSYGAVVLHVAPESAVGGPLALVETGDRVRIDVPARTLDVLLDSSELERRRAAWVPPPREERGYRCLYARHVMQANEGCDLDFLRGRSPVVTDVMTYL
jgi:dihydroxy-acid dehydratase